jgi:hypothetical protein
MPASAIPFTGGRYTSRGTTRIYFLTTIASYTTAVTRSELNAGLDLSTQIMDAEGWTVSSEQIDAPDMATRFTSKIAGSISAEDSSLTMYASRTGVDARATFSSGTSSVLPTSGFIVILYGGDIAANKMDVWPVTVASVAKQLSVQGDAPDTLVITFSPTAEPAQNLAIPA